MLGLLPLVAESGHFSLRVGAVAMGTALLKGIVFPWLLFRALREAEVNRQVEPYVGYVTSLLCGLFALGASFWISARLPLTVVSGLDLLVPVALFSILVGLFLIVARKRAVNQVLGFLILENGVFTFGAGVMQETSIIVEVGILLDVFVAVFVMGIAIFHINREFDHIEADRLSSLKD
jgi:hydrogenase-4 component E